MAVLDEGNYRTIIPSYAVIALTADGEEDRHHFSAFPRKQVPPSRCLPVFDLILVFVESWKNGRNCMEYRKGKNGNCLFFSGSKTGVMGLTVLM